MNGTLKGSGGVLWVACTLEYTLEVHNVVVGVCTNERFIFERNDARYGRVPSLGMS